LEYIFIREENILWGDGFKADFSLHVIFQNLIFKLVIWSRSFRNSTVDETDPQNQWIRNNFEFGKCG